MNFLDIDFPPVEASLYNPDDVEEYPFEGAGKIVWKRPHEFMA